MITLQIIRPPHRNLLTVMQVGLGRVMTVIYVCITLILRVQITLSMVILGCVIVDTLLVRRMLIIV